MARLEKLNSQHSLIPATAFAALPWWQKLSADDQRIVERESLALAKAQFHQGASKLEMGKHLIELRDRLDRYGVFVKHLSNFRMSFKTAYRYIDAYKNAKSKFPDAALSVILARGFDMLGDTPDKPYGKYTPVMKKLPPPKTNNASELNQWADQVEAKFKEYKSQVRAGEILPPDHDNPSPETSLKEAFRFARIRLKRLPNSSKARSKFVNDLSGMLLAEIGVSGSQSIQPIAAPEDFRQGRGYPKGRPRTQSAE